jgi:hypothetical protein
MAVPFPPSRPPSQPLLFPRPQLTPARLWLPATPALVARAQGSLTASPAEGELDADFHSLGRVGQVKRAMRKPLYSLHALSSRSEGEKALTNTQTRPPVRGKIFWAGPQRTKPRQA